MIVKKPEIREKERKKGSEGKKWKEGREGGRERRMEGLKKERNKE